MGEPAGVCCTSASQVLTGNRWSGQGLRFCISNKLCGDADVAGLLPTLRGAQVDAMGEFEVKKVVTCFLWRMQCRGQEGTLGG